jgi:ribosome maturation factor RimP
MSTELLETIQDLVDPILDDFGLECVDIEFKREGQGQVLRIFIDKPDGVSLDDCVSVSREVSAILEVEDPISKAYRLEVSSPGLDRPLKKVEDFERFSGQLVRVKTYTLIDPDERGHKRKTFKGKLLGPAEDGIRILQTDKEGGEVIIPFGEIAKANLEPEF